MLFCGCIYLLQECNAFVCLFLSIVCFVQCILRYVYNVLVNALCQCVCFDKLLGRLDWTTAGLFRRLGCK